MTLEELNASYAIIRYNIRTYRSAGVIAVISGKRRAEVELKKFEDSQESSDRLEGWRYLIDKPISRREPIPRRQPSIARMNWMRGN